MANNIITILKEGRRFTPYQFYNDFLSDVAEHYRNGGGVIEFKLCENGDEEIYDSRYLIDPIVIPLLLSLFEQLSKFHNQKINLQLFNNAATNHVLAFLDRSDFFHVAGNNSNPTFPKGRNLMDFERKYLGAFPKTKIRDEHRVRAYSIIDDNLKQQIALLPNEEAQRDLLISHYTYKVRDHFESLLFENDYTIDLHNIYIDILSELITNAVLHSGSNAFALMFVDRFRTKFSISDNGVGFEYSMARKPATSFFKPGSLLNALKEKRFLNKIADQIVNNMHVIFETLFYSSLKDRTGIFDLMTNVVLSSNGYFRVHCENSQLIISHRMRSELIVLDKLRDSLRSLHNTYKLNKISEGEFLAKMDSTSNAMMSAFVSFYESAVEKYSSDIKYSSLRFFRVKFRGVHIEVEIPNPSANDNF